MKQDHIIQKVFVEITVNNKEKAFAIKEDISSFLSMDVFPEIEKYVNALEHDLDDQILQIPSLKLDLNIKNSSLNAELKDKMVQIFKEKVSKVTESLAKFNQKTENTSEAYLINHQEKMVQSLLYFLEKGNMPWWNSDKKSISFLEPSVFETLISAESFQKKIPDLFLQQNFQERIINQLSDEQIAQVCKIVLKNKELKIILEADTIHWISKLNLSERQIVWRLILGIISQPSNSSNASLKEVFLDQIAKTKLFSTESLDKEKSTKGWKTISEIFPFIKKDEVIEVLRNNARDHPENIKISRQVIHQHHHNEGVHEDTTPKNDELSDQDNGQYIQNAGLILIHPFTKALFEHCDLLDPKTQQLTNPELCVHLLHYIATGNTNAPEYDMAFEKFLCNIPMTKTINRHIKLSRNHKTQAKNVIESLQQNWSPMKKSSVALLQNEFFQRPGKLIITDYDISLTVERKTQDILLDRLSWGMSLVKLPWKDRFIFINW